jgi:hypothetical protein
LVVGRSRLHAVRGRDNVWTASDSLDIVRGRQKFRVGGSIAVRANQLNTVAVGFPERILGRQRSLDGRSESDLLTGLTSLAIHDQEFGGGNTGRRWKLYRPFVQDNWRSVRA